METDELENYKRLLKLALKDKWLGINAVTTDANQLVWIRHDGKPVGFFTPKLESDGRYRTGTIFIEPKFRGKGLASNTVKAYFDDGDKSGRAWIEPTNHASQSIYKRAGFYKSGRITHSKTTSRMFEEWVNKPYPPLSMLRSLGW